MVWFLHCLLGLVSCLLSNIPVLADERRYAFPPLLGDIIMKDVGLTKAQILNSNIVGLCATLIVRLIAGPCCDRFGPRYTFAGCLIAGAIPSFCSGGITNASGLYAVRFFVGILGGSFVPCQVWTTGFFDKNTVGFANALTGGWGNAGGGVTYFVMPAIFNSLVTSSGLAPHVAWRVAFVVPAIIISFTALALVLCCPDTPTGKWSERHLAVESNLRRHSMIGVVVPGAIGDEKRATATSETDSSPERDVEKKPAVLPPSGDHFAAGEAHLDGEQMMETAKGEVIQKPTFSEIMKVVASPHTLVLAAGYFCSFGAELAINSILGTYYTTHFGPIFPEFKKPQHSGNWAAMFGLLNIAFRPLGGLLSDRIYKALGGANANGQRALWGKKIALHSFGVITGAFLIAIGVLNSYSQSTMFGLVAGMAFFLEAGNGLNYALVPHVHPYANGVVSGFTGAMGNFGGIIFSVIFRFAGPYNKGIWIIGVMTIGLNLIVAWIRPVSPLC